MIAIVFLGCSSDSSDDCQSITCLNGGISNSDCGCDCPQGYTGSNCNIQIQPTTIKITKILIKSFPYTNNGIGWDSVIGNNANEADLLIRLFNSNGQPFNVGNSYFENASNAFSYLFTMPSPIIINNANELLSLEIYDYDYPDSDDFIKKTFFYVYNVNGGFPTIKTITDGNVMFDVYLEYVW